MKLANSVIYVPLELSMTKNNCRASETFVVLATIGEWLFFTIKSLGRKYCVTLAGRTTSHDYLGYLTHSYFKYPVNN